MKRILLILALVVAGCWNPTPAPPIPTPEPTATATATVQPPQAWPVAPTGVPTPIPGINHVS